MTTIASLTNRHDDDDLQVQYCIPRPPVHVGVYSLLLLYLLHETDDDEEQIGGGTAVSQSMNSYRHHPSVLFFVQ